MFTFSLETGMYIMDVFRLEMSDVDVKNRALKKCKQAGRYCGEVLCF